MSESEGFIGNVIRGDLDAVRQALADQPSLAMARDPHLGSTPLHFASHRGFTEIVDALLDVGADPHALERASGSTPLHWAAEGGHLAVARLLVQRGAQLEILDDWYRLTPLGWATFVTWTKASPADKAMVATFLRELGARVDVFTALVGSDEEGLRAIVAADPGALSRRLGFVEAEMSPLHVALTRRKHAMTRLLLQLGADPRATTAWGVTPIAMATAMRDTESAELLRNRGVEADLATAVLTGDVAAIDAQLSGTPRGADSRDLLLLLAARAGLAQVVAALLRHGADPNVRAMHLIGEVPAEVSPLHLVAKEGHAEIARLLLDAGANPSVGIDDGIPTPLHVAAGSGQAATVRILLDRGADVTAVERGFGATPIGWAEHSGHANIVTMLTAPPNLA